MGGVAQQINLYRDKERSHAADAGARLLLVTVIGSVLVLVLIALVGEIYLHELTGDRVQVAERLQRQERALAEFNASLAPAPIDPHLEAELARLRDAQRYLNANLVALSGDAGVARGGFSEVFSGLARNTREGIWFSQLGLYGGGAEMRLKGRTTEPAMVPRLLQSLAVEPAFAGRTFRKVNFERHDSAMGAVVDFELRSAASEEGDDAG